MVEAKAKTETQHNNTNKRKGLLRQTLCGLLSGFGGIKIRRKIVVLEKIIWV